MNSIISDTMNHVMTFFKYKFTKLLIKYTSFITIENNAFSVLAITTHGDSLPRFSLIAGVNCG